MCSASIGPNVREQNAFIRGVHSCPGAPLARAEGRILLNRIVDRMAGITISEDHQDRLAAISSKAAMVGNSLVASWGSGQLDSFAATTPADRLT
ncbi:cytochrome P450 [Mycobacterium sp. URHB0021]|jgi:cytochrome P450